MSKVITPDVSNVTMQDMHVAGLNPFGVDLVVESYASPRRSVDGAMPAPLEFVWRGVRVQLSVVTGPTPDPDATATADATGANPS